MAYYQSIIDNTPIVYRYDEQEDLLMNNLNFLKNQLDNSINELLLNYHPFLTDGGNHFSRNRKIPLKTLIEYILFMGSNALKDELYDLSNFNDTPSVSAFVQQRRKISADAFRFLFDSFNKRTYSPQNGLFIGYRLLAVDGSSVPISHNPKDEDTYIKQISKGGLSGKGHNAFHLNAMYDLLDHTYTDAVIQGEAHMNENDAFNTMILRYNGAKAIFIADRGFESLNSFVYVMKKHQKFLIRVKDIHSNGLLSSLPEQESSEFDIDYQFIATTKQTNEVKSRKDIYKFMSTTSRFDHFEENNPYYPVNLRIVRIRIGEDKYESIMTNLDRDEFSYEDIKKLYEMRWGIETSFREIKYSVGLNAFHAKNRESIKQEIYAKLLFYNFSERIIRKVRPKTSKKNRKYQYAINATRAFHNIRIYMKRKRGGQTPPDIESIIANDIEPVRPDRSDPRKVRKQAPVHFIYRFQ